VLSVILQLKRYYNSYLYSSRQFNIEKSVDLPTQIKIFPHKIKGESLRFLAKVGVKKTMYDTCISKVVTKIIFESILGLVAPGAPVEGIATAAAVPVLEERVVDGGLGMDGFVHGGGHDALLDAEVFVDDLGQRGETVGGAGGVGHDAQVLGVLLAVHAHHEHGSVVLGRNGHDDFLGTADEVLGCAGIVEELASGFDDVVGAVVAPQDLGGIQLVGHKMHLPSMISLPLSMEKVPRYLS